MIEENLCDNCFRICKIRNTDRTLKVVECNVYMKDFTGIVKRKIVQTKLEF